MTESTITNTEQKEITGNNYNMCPVWMAYTFDNPLRRLFHQPENMFARFIKPTMKVIDLGSGLGFFSLPMAKLVGEKGCVYSIDIQQEMLNRLMLRAKGKGLADRIKPTLCTSSTLNMNELVDFALVFWMLHETNDTQQCLENLYNVLQTEGILYLAEPKFHVNKDDFEKEITIALKVGFVFDSYPKVRLSYAVALKKK